MTGMRGNVNAPWFDGTKPPAIGDGKFDGITCARLSPAEAKELVEKTEAATKPILTTDLYKIEMTTSKGNKAALIMTAPANEPFQVTLTVPGP